MGQREIEKRLKQYGALSKKLVSREKESRMKTLLEMESCRKGSHRQGGHRQGGHRQGCHRQGCHRQGCLGSFIWEQVGYLERYCLLWQALWLAVFLLVMKFGIGQYDWAGQAEGVLAVLSLLTPILVLITARAAAKVYQKTMLEIEYTTKYSLQSVVMLRMLTLCLIHSLILAAGIFFQRVQFQAELGKVFVYGFTPMIIMTGILLLMMQYWSGELLYGGATGGYVLMAALIFWGCTKQFGWYRPVWFKTWCLAGAAGMVFGIWQFHLLYKKLEGYEKAAQ